MVGLQAMVLGRLGRKPSSHPRACALSCPSLAVYGPGSLGHLTRSYFFAATCKPIEVQHHWRMFAALPRPNTLRTLAASPAVLAHNTRRLSASSPSVAGPSGRLEAPSTLTAGDNRFCGVRLFSRAWGAPMAPRDARRDLPPAP